MNKDCIYSFDVFDTCLVRLCGEARNVFDILSAKLARMMEDRDNSACFSRELFVVARTEASGMSLKEIYEQVAKRFPLPCSIEQMINLELETESEMLRPVLDARKMVEEKRKDGRIIFISDMYLPSSFIVERLAEYGFYKKGDALYVSDEMGAWKRDGTLYKVIRQRERVSYRRWHHYGDNRSSDYLIPRRLGIHAHHIHFDYSFYEEKWRDHPALHFQYPSMLAGISRSIRLQSEGDKNQGAFVCNLMAPLLITWIWRVLTEAQSRGIRRLYFLSRDAHTPFLIAKSWSNLFPEIEIRYLYVSRIAMESPLCFDYLTAEGMTDGVPKAIVDVTTSGKTLLLLNQWLKSLGINPISGFYWLHHTKSYEANARSLFVEIWSAYLNIMTPSVTNRLAGMNYFFEIFFSFNRDSQTVGYKNDGSGICPIFTPFRATEDDWHCINGNPSQFKALHDKMILEMAAAMQSTGLLQGYEELLRDLSISTITDFVSYPRKELIKYMKYVSYKGKPFVGSLAGPNKGVWKRGNRANSIPDFILTPTYMVLSQPYFRKHLNRMVSNCLK